MGRVRDQGTLVSRAQQSEIVRNGPSALPRSRRLPVLRARGCILGVVYANTHAALGLSGAACCWSRRRRKIFSQARRRKGATGASRNPYHNKRGNCRWGWSVKQHGPRQVGPLVMREECVHRRGARDRAARTGFRSDLLHRVLLFWVRVLGLSSGFKCRLQAAGVEILASRFWLRVSRSGLLADARSFASARVGVRGAQGDWSCRRSARRRWKSI